MSSAAPVTMRRNTAVLLAGQLGRIAVQGVYFVLLARALGAERFGAAAAVLAIVAMTLPFAGLGSTLVMVRNVSQERGPIVLEWANAVCAAVLTGVVLTILLALVGPLVAPAVVSTSVVVAVAAADLVFFKVTEQAGGIFAGQSRMARAAWFPVVLQASRLIALVVLLTGPWQLTLGTWALSYLVGSVPVAVVTAATTCRTLGWVRPEPRSYMKELRTTGLLFSLGISSQTIYNDADKAFLARLGTLHETGLYAAAYRVVDMSYAPIRALLGAAAPAMWAAGRDGLAATLVVVRDKLVRPVASYCVVGSLSMLAGADLVPVVLGDDYQDSVPALRFLSLLLLFKGAHYVAADTLTAAGHQAARTVVQVGIAVANVVLCLALIPTFGYWGAVTASLVCDGVLAVALWVMLTARLREENRRRVSAKAPAHCST